MHFFGRGLGGSPAKGGPNRQSADVCVVSEVLLRKLRIFVEFELDPRNRGVSILNEFQRLPLVLALFSSN